MFGKNIKQNQNFYDAEKIAWIRLARSNNIGPIRLMKLVTQFGSAQKAVENIPNLQRFQNVKLASLAQIEDEIAAVQRTAALHLCLYEEGYPDILRMIADPPPVLTIKGAGVGEKGLEAFIGAQALAFVGARNASINGRKMTYSLIKALNEAHPGGYSIISGMARGIDAAAHEAALACNIGTVAVLAGGVDQIYPKENEALYHKILEKGYVITETAYGVKPSARLFPRRNRIVSGLSVGTVVIEAALKSGSLITARCALEQGREVFAVPGFPLDPRGAGPNSLIQQGAKLVTCAGDIAEELPHISIKRQEKQRLEEGGGLFDHGIDEVEPEPLGRGKEYDNNAVDDTIEARILGCLSAAPLHVDELIRKLEEPSSAVQAGLMMLEMDMKIQRLHGNRVILMA